MNIAEPADKIMTRTSSLIQEALYATPEDMIFFDAVRQAPDERRRFWALLCACFIIHAFVVFLVFYEYGTAPEQLAAEVETPVEVIVEPPPPQDQKPEPPPPILPPDRTPVPQMPPPLPPKPQVYNDVNPAFDAPKTATNETHENREHDKETNSPTPTAPQPAAAPPPEQDLKARIDEEAHPEAEEKKPVIDKLDAEALDKTKPDKPTPPQPKKEATRTKDAPKQPKGTSMAKTFSELSSVPNFSVAMAARPTPIGGGTERAAYTSVLYGLIMAKQQKPPSFASIHYDLEVVIGFAVDELGNLVHQALYRTSGFPDVDAAAMKALHRAAPFPPPPRGFAGTYVMRMPFEAR